MTAHDDRAYRRFVRGFAERHSVDLEVAYEWPAEVEAAYLREFRLFEDGRKAVADLLGDPNCPACLTPMRARGDLNPKWRCDTCGVVRVF